MLVSTETMILKRLVDIDKILETIKKAGFDAFDFSMFDIENEQTLVSFDDYKERAYKVKAKADELGLICNQAHSFFPTIRKNDEEWNKKGMMLTIRSLEIAGILGAKYCIVHPCDDYTAEENFEMYRELLPYAKKNNIKIALENMYNYYEELNLTTSAACSDPEDFNKHLSLLDKEYFGACLDIGHSEMRDLHTSAVKMIEGLGDRLTCLHIHDNDLIHDYHKLPYTYNIDFDSIIDALAKVGYKGDITFEAGNFLNNFPKELYVSAMTLMADIGKYFRSEIEKRRNK